MRQAHIQQLRRLVAEEITGLHDHKAYLKHLVASHWKLANPDTEVGIKNFWYLNETKNALRDITKRIQKLSLLIKALKKEEKFNSY